MNDSDKIQAYWNAMRRIGKDPTRFGEQTKEDKKSLRNSLKSLDSDYDHRWSDHPSCYTDNKAEQREMVRKSIQKRRQNWD